MKKVREVIIVADDHGSYHFNFTHTWNCDDFFVHPEKDGYVESGPNADFRYRYDTNYELVPRRLYLTPTDQVVMQKLEYEYSMSLGRTTGAAEGSLEANDYILIYTEFQKSKTLASTEAEHAFIKRKYCDRLIGLYQKLSPWDKEYLQRVPMGPGGTINHAREVEEFCALGAAARPAP